MNSPSNLVGSSRETSSFGAAQFQTTERGSVSAGWAFRGICLDVTVHLTCHLTSQLPRKVFNTLKGSREKPFLLHPSVDISIGFHLEDLRLDKNKQKLLVATTITVSMKRAWMMISRILTCPAQIAIQASLLATRPVRAVQQDSVHLEAVHQLLLWFDINHFHGICCWFGFLLSSDKWMQHRETRCLGWFVLSNSLSQWLFIDEYSPRHFRTIMVRWCISTCLERSCCW